MTSEVIEKLDRIPMSPALASTLARAAEYASSQSHVEVTLEHLLLALTEDADAEIVLATSNVDIGHLKSGVAEQLGRIEERLPLDQSTTTQISQTVTRILEASAQAASGRRAEINGAIVLAAIVGDGNSTAAHLLRAQGLTFEAAIKALQSSLGETPSQRDVDPGQQDTLDTATNSANRTLNDEIKRDPTTTSADDFLAEARAAVQSRTTTGRPKAAPSPAPPSPPLKKSADDDTERAPVGSKQKATPPPPPPVSAATEEEAEAAPPAAPVSWAPTKPATTQQPPPQPRPMRPPPPLGADGPTTGSPTQTGRPNHPAGPVPNQQQPRPNQGQPQRPGPQGHALPTSHQQGQPPRNPAVVGAPGAPTAPQQRPAAPAPAAGRAPGVPWPAPPGQARRQQTQPGAARAQIEDGQLVENIPRKMQVDVPAIAEVTIARADIKNLAGTLSGQSPAHRHEITVTKAMSVRLRAPKGGFYIESASPETQWLESTLGIETDEFARWRWTITPKTRGKKPLQVIVSARTMGADGMIAESALPDQVIEVKVRANLTKNTKRLIGWTVAAVAGGLLARFGEQMWETGRTLLQTFMSGA